MWNFLISGRVRVAASVRNCSVAATLCLLRKGDALRLSLASQASRAG
jgi:hypothetical protein